MSDKPGGNNRDWGYASSDDDGNLTYTSYEHDGSVNRYSDNGDGHHSHAHWDSKDDYNSGADPDWIRRKSGKSENPSVDEVENKGGCYLTTACMQKYKRNFNDNCYELEMLREFRNKFVTKEDIKHYYDNAPLVVETIDKLANSKKIYERIYNDVINPCIEEIENNDYDLAYSRYKNNELELEERVVKPVLVKKLVKDLKKIKH